MGRTIHYEIRGARELTAAQGYELGNVARLMNERFRWSAEHLALRFTPPLFAVRQSSEEDVRAWGFTKVGADDWNAYLVVRFLIWASTYLPDYTIKAYDEGAYITACMIKMRQGVPRADFPRLWDAQASCDRDGRSRHWVDRAIACGERGELFAKLPLAEYQELVPEIDSLELSPEELDGDVDSVAEQLFGPLGLLWVPVRI